MRHRDLDNRLGTRRCQQRCDLVIRHHCIRVSLSHGFSQGRFRHRFSTCGCEQSFNLFVTQRSVRLDQARIDIRIARGNGQKFRHLLRSHGRSLSRRHHCLNLVFAQNAVAFAGRIIGQALGQGRQPPQQCLRLIVADGARFLKPFIKAVNVGQQIGVLTLQIRFGKFKIGFGLRRAEIHGNVFRIRQRKGNLVGNGIRRFGFGSLDPADLLSQPRDLFGQGLQTGQHPGKGNFRCGHGFRRLRSHPTTLGRRGRGDLRRGRRISSATRHGVRQPQWG